MTCAGSAPTDSITRITHTRRYRITDARLQHALFFTHAHDHLLRTGLAELTDPDPPAPSRLRTAARAYQTTFHDLARYAHLAACHPGAALKPTQTSQLTRS